MAAPTVVVLDYGSGNVHSAAKALEAAGARVELTADRAPFRPLVPTCPANAW